MEMAATTGHIWNFSCGEQDLFDPLIKLCYFSSLSDVFTTTPVQYTVTVWNEGTVIACTLSELVI